MNGMVWDVVVVVRDVVVMVWFGILRVVLLSLIIMV